MSLNMNLNELDNNLDSIEARTRVALQLYGETAAMKLEAEAKENRPWTDRTMDAKRSIRGISYRRGDKQIIAVTGNVEYFKYLEFANGKAYAILYPTLRRLTEEILSGLRGMLNG
ncbi:MAG: HK97 gp10 family phage protein [Tissierellales bacterium]|jgi:hypothetical protein|nr:HK97 gp10 family phage protein [Tissierellales bacterium]